MNQIKLLSISLILAFLLLATVGQQLLATAQSGLHIEHWGVVEQETEGGVTMTVSFEGLLLTPDKQQAVTLNELTAVSHPARTLILTPTTITPIDEPYLITLLVDDSGSMRQNLTDTQELLMTFINEADPKAEISILTFSDMLQVQGGQTFTSNKIELAATIRALAPDDNNPTCLFDAAAVAADSMTSLLPNSRRRALLIFSDGVDENIVMEGEACSQRPAGELFPAAQSRSVSLPVFVVQFPYFDEPCMADDDWLALLNEENNLLKGMVLGCSLGNDWQGETTAIFNQIHRSFTQQFRATIPLHTYIQTSSLPLLANGQTQFQIPFTAKADHLPPARNEDVQLGPIIYIEEETIILPAEGGAGEPELANGRFEFPIILNPLPPRVYSKIEVTLINQFTGDEVYTTSVSPEDDGPVRLPATLAFQEEYLLRVTLPEGVTVENRHPSQERNYRYNPRLVINGDEVNNSLADNSAFARSQFFVHARWLALPVRAEMVFDNSSLRARIDSVFQPKVQLSNIYLSRADGNVDGGSSDGVTLRTRPVVGGLVNGRLVCDEKGQLAEYPITLGEVANFENPSFVAPGGWAHCGLTLVVSDAADGLTLVQQANETAVVVPPGGWGARIIWLRGLLAARWLWLGGIILFVLLAGLAYALIRLGRRLQDNSVPVKPEATEPTDLQPLRLLVESTPDETQRGKEVVFGMEEGRIFSIGAKVGSDLTLLEDDSVDKNHALIRYSYDQKRFALADCETSDGTFINEQRLVPQEWVPLPEVNEGKEVRIKIGRRTQLRVLPTPKGAKQSAN